MDSKVHQYIEKLYPKRSVLFTEMEEFAERENVPIMETDGMEVLLQWLRIQQPKRILEVGTAIGYSALRMADALPETEIISIDRDEERLDLAKEFIKRSGFRDRIHLIFGDALELQEKAAGYGAYDAIFIDAAKSQYSRFFELYSPLLTKHGVIYTDNVLFKGLVAEDDPEVTRNVKQLLRKIDRYNHWLMNNKEFDSIILPVGDGLAVSKKR
ncbi:O-methyltransferase [Jeotgalibacillus proteolyticus]|uniref:tRNA 5-hydroxyuridine methyltransferase n=1 Tax=Jeotgalibacillus proteolyticus TaxID=2082395 RepID=A0A2S5GF03_9BACL|nr:O-methyltransferase [Jeotgalibacillus proteolyticus]PPA71495.1 SAM-dependent methyltransferase [Jeotgalibacillus proteolyticus]